MGYCRIATSSMCTPVIRVTALVFDSPK